MLQLLNYVIDDMPLSASQIGSVNASKLSTSTYGTQKGDGVSFYGTLVKQNNGNNGWAAESSYVFTSDGNLTRLHTSHPIYGFRCWIVDNSSTSSGSAKSFMELININDGGVTSINHIADMKNHRNTDKVYNLSGQCIGTYDQIDRLPRGLYIVNGKKYVLK
ncbi:hypothetical protein [Prevotella phocaeensis]|uniref:hypothetical protein n=1 Tax=Prevotella phocaeensis TaxID=1776388 RepID=UPI0003D2D3B8|nr:hypothetical protein [Prevotella phocaeensis]ETD18795.1 hypothetical protein HMPREF1199_01615 [Hoylesella oralis CC98A]